MITSPLSVLVVDDSAIFRKVLKSVLSEDPRFEVVGTARNGQEALDMTAQFNPDAVVLDVEMPVMDGLKTLEVLRRKFPAVEVIMFSSLTRAGAEITVRAIELGAFDFVAKPEADSVNTGLASVRGELVPKLTFLHTRKTLRQVQSGRPRPDRAKTGGLAGEPAARLDPKQSLVQSPALAAQALAAATATPRPVFPLAPPPLPMRRRLVALGISTGGPRALAAMMAQLPRDMDAGMVIVQHMPPIFTLTLAQRLNELGPLKVREAKEGDVVEPGLALVAPGGRHMTVSRDARKGSPGVIRLNDDPPEHNCRPSVDVLFRSVAEFYGPEVVGVIMTGMGHDGTPGLKLMKDKGAFIIAQNEETCTVYGMPKKPIEEGLVHEVLPLEEIAQGIARAVTGVVRNRRG